MTERLHSDHWYALRLRSRFDFTVRDLLRGAGVPEYCPTFEQTSRWTDRTSVTTRPLFAGYIFARFSRAEVSRALEIRGVCQILGTGNNEYSTISDDIVADLRRIVDSRVKASPCPYVSGDAVTVAKGPFAGVKGVICRVRGATTLSIPVAILGRSVSVEIDAADVEKAD